MQFCNLFIRWLPRQNGKIRVRIGILRSARFSFSADQISRLLARKRGTVVRRFRCPATGVSCLIAVSSLSPYSYANVASDFTNRSADGVPPSILISRSRRNRWTSEALSVVLTLGDLFLDYLDTLVRPQTSFISSSLILGVLYEESLKFIIQSVPCEAKPRNFCSVKWTTLEHQRHSGCWIRLDVKYKTANSQLQDCEIIYSSILKNKDHLEISEAWPSRQDLWPI